MAWTRRTPTSATAAATTMVINTPGSVADGDIMCLDVMAATHTSTITVTGWTSVRNQTDSGNGQKLWSFQRIASSEPTNYTVNASPAEDMAGAMDAYAGGDTGTPVNVSNGSTTGNTTGQTSASITTTVDGALVRAVYGADSNVTCLPGTPDASPVATERTEVFQAGNAISLYVQDYEQPTQGAISLDMTWNAAPIAGCVNNIYALTPGAAGAAPSLRVVQSNLSW